MAASTREVFLLLRARDEASRVVRGFSSELSRSSEAMRAAALRTQALALQGEVTQRRQQTAQMSALAAEKLAQAAAIRTQIEQQKSLNISTAQLQTMRAKEKALRNETSELHNQIRVIDKGTSAMIAQLRMLDRQASELERADRLHRHFAQAVSSSAASLETVGVAFLGAATAAGFFFVKSFQSFQEYQRQVALTRTQIDGFQASLKDVSEIGLSIANRIPVAFKEIQPALFDIFSSTNANLQQATDMLESFSKAAVAGQTDVQTAARGTIAIINGLDIPFENVNHILDVQFELVRKGVGTYDEFAKVFGRIIPAANRSQQSFETVAAMLAFMTRNGQSAAQAATSAARALELFTHPGAVKNLEQMGVKVRDLKGNYLPLIDILKQLRTEMNKLPQADRVAAMVDAFKGSGFNIQARRFLEQVVLGQGELENFTELLGSMASASGVMGEKYAEMADTAAAKSQLLANKWEVLKIAVGEAVAPVMLKIIDIISGVIDAFNRLDPETKKTIINVAMIATAFAAVLGAGLLFLGVLAGIVAAVMAAGAQIFIVIGALAGLTVGLGATVAAVIVAWKELDSFRTLARDSAADVKELWTAIQELATRVRDAFANNLGPPIEKFQTLLNEKLLPAFNKFRSEVVDIVLPKISEAFRIIGDVAEAVFTHIGRFIDTIVVPALRMLAEWWDKNKQQIMPFVEAAAQLAKWIGIIAAIVIGSGILVAFGSLLAVIAALVGTFMLVIETIKIVKAAFNAVVDFIVSTSEAIRNKAIEIWNAFWTKLTEGVKAGINFVKDIIATVIAAILAGWEAFWSVFGEPIKAAWELIKAISELGLALQMFIIEFFKQKLTALWNSIWGVIGEPVKAAWNAITSTVSEGAQAVWQFVSDASAKVRNTVRELWDEVIEKYRSAWSTAKQLVTDGVNNVVNAVKSLRQKIMDFINPIKDTVVNFFTDLGKSLFESGKKIIQGLIDGITSKINDLTNKIKEITQKINDYLPHSPAKTGPLSGSGSPFKSGQAISNMLASGMLDKLAVLQGASDTVANALTTPTALGTSSALAPVGLGSNTAGALMPVRSNNVTVNVYTNEIDPRMTATELGWELEGRL